MTEVSHIETCLLCKSIGWSLYNRDLSHERVKPCLQPWWLSENHNHYQPSHVVNSWSESELKLSSSLGDSSCVVVITTTTSQHLYIFRLITFKHINAFNILMKKTFCKSSKRLVKKKIFWEFKRIIILKSCSLIAIAPLAIIQISGEITT